MPIATTINPRSLARSAHRLLKTSRPWLEKSLVDLVQLEKSYNCASVSYTRSVHGRKVFFEYYVFTDGPPTLVVEITYQGDTDRYSFQLDHLDLSVDDLIEVFTRYS